MVGHFLRLIDRQAQSRAVARFHDLIALAIIAPLIAGRMSSALVVEKQSSAREKQLASVHGLGHLANRLGDWRVLCVLLAHTPSFEDRLAMAAGQLWYGKLNQPALWAALVGLLMEKMMTTNRLLPGMPLSLPC